jgi:hypothetical protein
MSNASANNTSVLIWATALAYAVTDSALPAYRKARIEKA